MNTNGLWSTGDRLFDGLLTDEEAAASRPVPVTTEIFGVLHLRRSILTHAIEEFDGLVDEIDTILALTDASLGGA